MTPSVLVLNSGSSTVKYSVVQPESGMTVAEIRQSPMIVKISRMKDIENEVFEDKVKELWAEMEAGMVAR